MPASLLLAIAIAIPLGAQDWPLNIAGAPFSATRITELTKTLADGTRMESSMDKAVMYRDLVGRTRIEYYHPAAASVPGLISIVDPVAGVRFQVNTFSKKTRMNADVPPLPPSEPSPPARLMEPQIPVGVISHRKIMDGAVQGIGLADYHFTTTSELLGTQNIEGILGEGRRIVTTLEAGSVGNDQEIVVTNEMWYSKELRISVLRKLFDPRFGNRVSKLINISLTDPDSGLFVPPADYRIE